MRVLNALVFELFALFLIFTQNLTKIESFYSYMKIKFFHQKSCRTINNKFIYYWANAAENLLGIRMTATIFKKFGWEGFLEGVREAL
jgi:hypothetical protein